ncbi:MAG: HNH endonuclease [Dissulfurispiraceae bacterium]|jgi:hypothetical protein|nr:HNH endonuclease [Dissulfurispiraceae bacterium]
MARKAIPKRVRFEVFKRDSFKCQYCGATGPNVLLQIDHIKAVAKGGTNDIMNLVTSCESCNSGKSDKLLSDDAAINRSRTQLEELQERREQLEMMMKWQEGLKDLKESAIEKLCEHWHEVAPGFSINDNGKKKLNKLLREYPINEILEAMDIASEQYLQFDKKGNATDESWDLAYGKVGGICRIRKAKEDKPYLKDLFYTRGILRRRVYVNETCIMELLENAVKAGADTQWLIQLAKNCQNWTEFQEDVRYFINKNA